MARRRNRSSGVVLQIAQALPLWASVLIAAVVYLGLRIYAGDHLPMMRPVGPGQIDLELAGYLPKMLAFYGQFVIPPIFLIGGLLGALKRKVQSKKLDRIASAGNLGNAIRGLSWREFEQMVGEALRRQGYAVAETKSGPDGGVDLVLHKDGECFLVQCKQWKAIKVSVQVVRELYGVMASQGVAGGFVVTSGTFTAEARKFALGTNIHLIDGEILKHWFRPEVGI